MRGEGDKRATRAQLGLTDAVDPLGWGLYSVGVFAHVESVRLQIGVLLAVGWCGNGGGFEGGAEREDESLSVEYVGCCVLFMTSRQRRGYQRASRGSERRIWLGRRQGPSDPLRW